MRIIIVIILFFISKNILGRCDEYVNKSYDKFTKTTKVNFKKYLIINSASNLQFSIKPTELNWTETSVGDFKINTNGRIDDKLTLRITNNSSNSIFVKNLSAILLFDDGSTVKMYYQNYTKGSSIEIKNSGYNIFYLSTWESAVVEAYQNDERTKRYNEFVNCIKNKKLVAIRFYSISNMEKGYEWLDNSIDIDIPITDQSYFKTIYDCL